MGRSPVGVNLFGTVLGSVGCTATEVNPGIVEVESFAKGQVHCEGQDHLGNAVGNHRVDG